MRYDFRESVDWHAEFAELVRFITDVGYEGRPGRLWLALQSYMNATGSTAFVFKRAGSSRDDDGGLSLRVALARRRIPSWMAPLLACFAAHVLLGLRQTRSIGAHDSQVQDQISRWRRRLDRIGTELPKVSEGLRMYHETRERATKVFETNRWMTRYGDNWLNCQHYLSLSRPKLGEDAVIPFPMARNLDGVASILSQPANTGEIAALSSGPSFEMSELRSNAIDMVFANINRAASASEVRQILGHDDHQAFLPDWVDERTLCCEASTFAGIGTYWRQSPDERQLTESLSGSRVMLPFAFDLLDPRGKVRFTFCLFIQRDYRSILKILYRGRTPPGKRPFSIAFSDGQLCDDPVSEQIVSLEGSFSILVQDGLGTKSINNWFVSMMYADFCGDPEAMMKSLQQSQLKKIKAIDAP